MAQLKLYLFGAPRVAIDDTPVDLPRRKVLAALVYLVRSRKRIQRDALATLLWPEAERKSARSSLRRELHALNSAIGPKWLEMTRDDLMLNPDADVWSDVDEFRQCIANTLTDGTNPQTLKDAVALYQSDFLTGFTLSDCPAFDDWQFFESEELRRDYANALTELVQIMRAQNDYQRAVDYARRWLALDPLDELVHRELMQLYALAGQQAAAVRQYDECVRILDDELGVPPEEETVALYEAIRTRQFPEHDKMTRSLWMFHNRPSPHPVTQPPSHLVARHNLPSLSTSFVGRELELEAIETLLVDEAECRLLMLVGPGGIGKTRLSLAVAQNIVENAQEQVPQENFRDGIYFVPLAEVSENGSILPALADALSFSFQGTVEPLAQLINYLKTQSLLLILDNFENLLEQAELLSEMLSRVPALTLLITSREALTLQEEWLYAVSGFPTPSVQGSLEQFETNTAVQLFLQRARRSDSSLTLTDKAHRHIARICELVDGMPLGIELAATWVRVLSIEEIATEIESSLDFLATTKHSVLDRHSSMRTVLDQTWQLLSQPEQDAFCKHSIFRNGFTRQAASRVADVSMIVLAALVRKSILFKESNGRYAIHGLLRQFAATKLAERPAQANTKQVPTVQEQHARYFGAFLERFEEELIGDTHATALHQIEEEIDNARAGWRWVLTNAGHNPENVKLANRYVGTLFQFYDTRSRFQEGHAEFQLAFEQLDALKSTSELQLVLGRVGGRLGWFAFQIGQPAEAKALLERSIDLLRRLDAEPNPRLDVQGEMTFSLNYLGAIHRHLNEYDAAQSYLHESQQLCRDRKDRFGLTVALNILGQIAYEHQECGQAQTHLEESLAIKQAIGDERGTTFSLLYLGLIAREQEEYAKAVRLFNESMMISEEHGDRRGIAVALNNLGDTYVPLEQPEKAQTFYEQSLNIYVDIHNLLGIVTTRIKLGDLANSQQALMLIQPSNSIRQP